MKGTTAYVLAKKYFDEHAGWQAVLVGTVSEASAAFPTARPDGSALVLGDFVKPASGATFPFTVGGITFQRVSDQAVFAGNGNWLYNANPFQKTSETPLDNPATESVSGTAIYQDDANIEAVAELAKKVDSTVTEDSGAKSIITNSKGNHGSVMQSVFGDTVASFNTADENGEDGIVGQVYAKTASTGQGTRLNLTKDGFFYSKGTSATTNPGDELATKGEIASVAGCVHEQATASAEWTIAHNMGKYPAVTVIDSAGSTCVGEIAYIDKDTVKLTFNAAFGGKAYLS